MDRKQHFLELSRVLEGYGFPLMDRLRTYRSTLEISVQNFIAIVAFLGNIACHPSMGIRPFPKIYDSNPFRITVLDRAICLELIRQFMVHLRLPHKMTTKDIISDASARYMSRRADFLLLLLDFVDQERRRANVNVTHRRARQSFFAPTQSASTNDLSSIDRIVNRERRIECPNAPRRGQRLSSVLVHAMSTNDISTNAVISFQL